MIEEWDPHLTLIFLGQRDVAGTPEITPFQKFLILSLSEHLLSPIPVPGIVQSSRNLMLKKAIQTSVPTDHGEAWPSLGLREAFLMKAILVWDLNDEKHLTREEAWSTQRAEDVQKPSDGREESVFGKWKGKVRLEKTTGVWEMRQGSCWLVTKLCPTLSDLTDCSLPGSSVHVISQARILEWVVIFFSRGSSWLRDWTQVSCLAGGFLTTEPPGKPLGTKPGRSF